MKPSAFVLNTARGKMIDEAAVARAIAEDRLQGRGSTLSKRSRLLPTRYCASSATRCCSRPTPPRRTTAGSCARCCDGDTAVMAALSGQVPDNVFNKDVIPRWKARLRRSEAVENRGIVDQDLLARRLVRRPVGSRSIRSPSSGM
jgi:hypothetical protein